MGSLILVKPDAFERKLLGEITQRIHDVTTVCRSKYIPAIQQDQLDEHYAEHVGKPFYSALVEAMTGKPAFAIHVYGDCLRIRQECLQIRKRFLDPDYVGPRNLIHSSDSEDSFHREVNIWFPQVVTVHTP
jgi:nucleoside-diphosphate kinase